AYRVRGRVYLTQGKYKASLTALTQAIREGPGVSMAHIWRGMAKVELRDLDGALTDFNDAVKYDQKSDVAYHERAILFMHRGNFAAALRDVTKSLALNPKSGAA